MIQNKEKEFEACVFCGVQTDVPRDTPVDLRGNYVEGAGQLCPGCYEKIFGEAITQINE